MNLIDMLSVYYSILEFIADYSSGFFSDIYGINFLRYFRFLRILLVLRILKFCVKFEYMNFIISVLKKSLYSFIVIIGIFFLVISFYALIGRSVLVYYYEKSSSNHFSSFSDSFITTFIIITMDNWYSILIEGVSDSYSLMLISSFVISILLLGNFIFLNLFLTVLLDSFENENQLLKQEMLVDEENSNISEPTKTIENFLRGGFDDDSPRKKREAGFIDNKIINQINLMTLTKRESFFSNLLHELTNNKSLFCFGNDDTIRIYSTKISAHNYFRKLSKFIIINQIILNIIQSYYLENYVIVILNCLIYIFFTIEGLLKIISKGFLLENDAYLRSFSNIINFSAVFSYYINFYYYGKSSSLNVIFAIFHSMMPLRLFETSKKLKKIVMSLWQSLDEIANVVLALLIVWYTIKNFYNVFFYYLTRFIISIWGVSLFRDRFGYCERPDNYNHGILQVFISSINKLKIYSLKQCPENWIIYRSNFETVYSALLTLLEISTFDSWSLILNIATNSDLPANVFFFLNLKKVLNLIRVPK